MEAVSYIKYLKISPKKVRFYISDLKEKTPAKALSLLSYAGTRSAKVLYKAIKAAADSARLLKMDENKLKFKVLKADEGPRLKRFRAGGRGVARPYKHRSTHIKVVLTDDNVVNSKKKQK